MIRQRLHIQMLGYQMQVKLIRYLKTDTIASLFGDSSPSGFDERFHPIDIRLTRVVL